MDEYDKELNKYLKRIKNKFEDNPELKDEIEDLVYRLTEIFESEVDLSVKFDLNVEDYRKEYIKYEDEDLELTSDKVMKVSDLKSIIDEEEQHLYLSVDPIYLKQGINDIEDLIITTYENKLILVPVTEKK
jgi:hypothetical protein